MLLLRMLLQLYPASWRAEYGSEMLALSRRRQRDTTNLFTRAGVWFEAIADLLSGALAVHFDLLGQDLRYAARTFARSPGFVVTAIAIAAVGIGATTAAFTMLDHVLIRSFPYSRQDRLVKLYEDHITQNAHDWDLSPADYRDWKHMSQSFENMAAYAGLQVNITGQGEPQSIDGARVTAEMFPTLGVQPSIGRLFTEADDQDSAAATAILSYRLWQSLFSGDPDVLGRTIRLYDIPYTVIGVMPKGFYFPNREAQIWTPMRWAPQNFSDRLDTYIYVIARLKPGIALPRAQAEMTAIAAQLARAHPKELAQIGATVVLLRGDVSVRALLMLKVLLASALCVLLISCTNLANLLLARAMTRRRELAVRTALGAGRERLVRQMLTESLLLAFAGGALGLLIAYSALPLLVRLVPVSLPIAEIPSVDTRVLLFALAITLLTGVGFGIVPALRAFGDGTDLREGGRSGVGGRRVLLRNTLVIAEVAGSVVLLVAFGLLTRALWRIQQTDPGFRAGQVLTLRTALPVPRYQEPAAREPFYRHVLVEARRLPGVTGAAYTSFLPLLMRGGIWPFTVEGRAESTIWHQTASLRFVTPGFFSTMEIPLLAGRDVSERDASDAPYVALVSQSLVRRCWPNQDPLGRTIDIGNNVRKIVGVVGDVRVRGFERESEPQVYVSWQQAAGVSPWYAPKDLVVRSQSDPSSLAPALRRIIHEADPSQPISDVRPLTAIVEAETASRRVQSGALGVFGAIAVLLAAVGIHGLLSFAVSNRTQEIGVRIALGASRHNILSMILREGFSLSAIGIAVGVALAYATARLLDSLLAGVQPGDLATFTAAAILSLAMTLAGSLLPAFRALRVDPVTAIRTE